MPQLERHVAERFRYRGAPEPARLARFLWTFAGEDMRNHDYASEFGFSHDVSKRQLGALVKAQLLRMLGAGRPLATSLR